MPGRTPLLLIALFIVGVPALCLALLGAWSRRAIPRASGSSPERLAPCPASPNCVTSLGDGGSSRLPPLRFADSAEGAWRRLAGVLRSFPRTTIVRSTDRHLHVTFRTAIFGFVDDVEFVLDEPGGHIDFRSASRVGHFDFGANRRRLLEIARRFAGTPE